MNKLALFIGKYVIATVIVDTTVLIYREVKKGWNKHREIMNQQNEEA